ncbi:hypothetical protein E8E13_009806 [Curvularia kusanoi]|uniref:BHLH domain-containing protein n=1 Tax=Curvularia kusanoi TaxID=90978 RepID=A0A9P4WAR7_CURKU|nr:hypothetical protein E8E13_009806 [Curvularia kusanoi]
MCSFSTFFDTRSFFGESITSPQTTPDLSPDIPGGFDPVSQAGSHSESDATPSPSLVLGIPVPSTRVVSHEDCAYVLPNGSDTIETSVSPSNSKHNWSGSPKEFQREFIPLRSPRKRGRPRLDRNVDVELQLASSAKQCIQSRSRVPHNQVERKYREGLNSEIEKLRRAVPTLPQSDEIGVIGQPKPSKAVVLAAAVDYIKSTERERDELKKSIKKLKSS